MPNSVPPVINCFHIGISGNLVFGQPLAIETDKIKPRFEKKSKNKARIAICPNVDKFGNFDLIQLSWIIKRYLKPDKILQHEQ